MKRSSSGSANFAVTPNEDVYLDPSSVSANIVSATGGNFEQLNFSTAPVFTQITDTITNATLSFSGPDSGGVDSTLRPAWTVTQDLSGGYSLHSFWIDAENGCRDLCDHAVHGLAVGFRPG